MIAHPEGESAKNGQHETENRTSRTVTHTATQYCAIGLPTISFWGIIRTPVTSRVQKVCTAHGLSKVGAGYVVFAPGWGMAIPHRGLREVAIDKTPCPG